MYVIEREIKREKVHMKSPLRLWQLRKLKSLTQVQTPFYTELSGKQSLDSCLHRDVE